MNINSIRNVAATLIVIAVGAISGFATAPGNDNFANAEILSGVRVSVVRSNIDATKESGEPNHATNIGGRSVWFKWTASVSGPVSFSTNRTEQNLDTLLNIYSGTSFATLDSVAYMNDITLTNRRSVVKILAVAGTTYYIAVDGFNDGQGAAAGQFRFDIIPINLHEGADFDADGKTDLVVYRPNTNTYYALNSASGAMTAQKFGTTGDIPVAGSRVGNKSEFWVYRPSTGVWYSQNCCSPVVIALPWGVGGDIPVPETYLGGQGSGIAVFRPSEGTWYLSNSGHLLALYTFGTNGDIPVPGRYTPDAIADIAVYRPSTGVWYFLRRHTQNPVDDTFRAVQFGQAGDKPVPGDYDGDGILDPAVFRPSTGQFWVLQSTDNQQRAFRWGVADDIPVTGDFDGDGIFDFAVFRPSNGAWYIFQSDSQQMRAEHFGTAGDIPMTSNLR